ncbi:hypothetical protein IWW34DRAFT_707831 [Fusarium oxysporum f. sp. albedinis]|nr:hypothetical protein IWW34DRAFT_707831 [Fusarium oxysporum f. sp. albedinis]
MTQATSLTPSDAAQKTLILTYIFLVLALIAAIDHVNYRRCQRLSFRWDDIITLLGFVVSVALVGQVTWAVVNEGQGQHLANFPQSHFNILVKSLFANEILWSLVNTLMRLSTLLFLYRIFQFHARTPRHITLSLTLLHGIATILVATYICRPIQAAYMEMPGKCGNQKGAYLGLETVGLVLDVVITCIPIFITWSMRLLFSQKITVVAIFSANGLQCYRVVIVTALRIASLRRVDSYDFSYDQGYLGLLSTVGGVLNLLICCATSISWRIRRFLGHVHNMQAKPGDLERSIASQTTHAPPALRRLYPSLTKSYNAWTHALSQLYFLSMRSYDTWIFEKVLDKAYHLAWSQRYPVATTFSYRLVLSFIYSLGLAGVRCFFQIVWKSSGRGILIAIDPWRAARRLINTQHLFI